jgi:anthranilate phosphoribosyltransferase
VVAAFLGALAARGEEPQELAGFAEAFREAVVPFPQKLEAVDTCGTGGDGRHTFNLSTAAALTVAALGVPVAKHGNRSVSSACGSADLLAALGYPLDEEPGDASRRLSERGFAFLFAPRYHPAMAHVAPVRRALGVRTVFNLMGPLLNPAGVARQVVGVYAEDKIGLVAGALRELGIRRALVVHGEGGYDEAVLHGKVRVAELQGGGIERYDLAPSDFGLPAGEPRSLEGGSPEDNARLLEELLAGRGRAGLAEAVAANAALALRAAEFREDVREGAGEALEALSTGRVGQYVKGLLGRNVEVPRAQAS